MTEKQMLMASVRSAYQLPTTTRMHFQRSEMEGIVNSITGTTPEWTAVDNYFEEELTSYGWTPQTTVDTHPTATNLHFLLNAHSTTSQTSRMSSLLQMLRDSGYINPRQMVVNEDNIVVTF